MWKNSHCELRLDENGHTQLWSDTTPMTRHHLLFDQSLLGFFKGGGRLRGRRLVRLVSLQSLAENSLDRMVPEITIRVIFSRKDQLHLTKIVAMQ